MSIKIYTKTGDNGTTSLIGGTKVRKNHIRIEAYGTIDELNSFTGLLCDYLKDKHSIAILREIQDRLFTIGSILASDPAHKTQMKIPALKPEDVLLLENEIDSMTALLPPMKSFVLPGGHITVSTAHIVRCICRRAERICVNMVENKLPIDPLILQYLNRLSDYHFTLARFLSHQLNVPEIKWQPRI